MRYLLLALVASVALGVTSGTPAAAGERRTGGKLILTDGIASVDGAAGGGLASWALIAGSETRDGIGATAHATVVTLPDYDLLSAGAAVGLFNRLELSYAHQRFDTGRTGSALGLGSGFTFGQDIISAKVRVAGDAMWDQDTVLPQISVGVQHKIANRGAVISAVGGRRSKDTDFYVAATKVLLSRGLVIDATLRFTRANQFGLLGYGGDRQAKRTPQFEGSAGVLLTRRLLLGAEYRTKPDTLGFARENDAYDLFAAWALQRHVTVTAAFVDLGNVATRQGQRGLFLSLKGGF